MYKKIEYIFYHIYIIVFIDTYSYNFQISIIILTTENTYIETINDFSIYINNLSILFIGYFHRMINETIESIPNIMSSIDIITIF